MKLNILLAVIISLFCLTGCPPTPPITLKTVILNPTNISHPSYFSYSQTWECNVPLPGQGLYANGLGAEPVGPGQSTVGYEDIFNAGAQPLPCNEQEQTIYRAHVQFDTSKFDTVAGTTLTYNIAQSENSTGGSAEVPANSYATVMGMSTGQISDGNGGQVWWNYDNEVTLASCGNLIQPNCSQDLSFEVNQWTSQQHFNYGMIIAGPKLNIDDNLPSDNKAQLTWYDDFQLVILYNPALNPRAPQ